MKKKKKGRMIYLFFYKKGLKQPTTTLYEPWIIQYFCKVSHPKSSNMASMQYNKIFDM